MPSCTFFVKKSHRHKGLTTQLLKAAVDHVKQREGKIIEGYPVDPPKGNMPAAFVWTGLFSAFKQAGFVECLRRSPTRPIMRYHIK